MADDLAGRDVLTAGAMSGFAPVEDADYDPIRRMARRGDSIVWRE
jgi:ABC-type phosphate/phosphonate transport system substrate-binding protein